MWQQFLYNGSVLNCRDEVVVRVLIVANAPVAPDRRLAHQAALADYIIAADGGAHTLVAAHITPHLLIGDLDSLSPTLVAQLAQQQVEIRRYAREKDETDLELAFIAAVEAGATDIDLFCVLGGRWDHTFATIAMLTLPLLTARNVRIFADQQTLCIVRDTLDLPGTIGDVLSLLPLTTTVDGITTTGLAYPLVDATLRFEHSRGVSNVITQEAPTITIKNGILLVVHHVDGVT